MPVFTQFPLELNSFKQQVVDLYDERKESYDLSDFHQNLAQQLIQYANLQPGERILDVATGTGLVAIAAAQIVGNSGQAIGVDISTGLLSKAREKIKQLNLTNIKLALADAETLKFPPQICDRVFCCSALPLMTDIPAALKLWRRFLVPGGAIGLCVFAETAFVTGVVLQKVAKKQGISLIFNDATGTEEKCYALLEEAGFQNISVRTGQFGNYIDMNQVKRIWESSLKHPFCTSLLKLSPQQLEQVRRDYIAELEAKVTGKGIWNDITAFFVFGTQNSQNCKKKSNKIMEICSQSDCTNPVSKPGHTLCYGCWKKANTKPISKPNINPKPKINPKSNIVNSPMLLSATKISQKLKEQNHQVHRNNVNRILSELGLLEKKGTDWIATRRGIAFGATQKNDPKTGNSYVLWSPDILENRIFLEAIQTIISETKDSNIPETKSEQGFREKFRESAKFRTTDGHWVRSKAEVMIDNWLYMAELVHAYERRLPIAEEVYCDFYIPSGKVYLEYWGYENDSKYLDRKREKQRIYQQYDLNLIEIVDENVRDLDDFLPKILLKFGVQVS